MKSSAFIVPFLALLLLTAGAFQVSPNFYVVGDIVEDFTLKNVDGNMVSLSDFKGVNGYIVVFTCNHCPYAQLYEQRIINLHHKYAAQGYPVVAINPNAADVVPEDSFEEMQSRAREANYPFVYLHDENQKVYPRFNATRTPHVYLLDANKKVRYIGAIDDNPENPRAVKKRYVENAIASLQRNEDPTPFLTKAVGCTIKKSRLNPRH